MFRQNAYEWGEDNTAAIEHHYTYLMLDGESAKSNRALAASLEDARDQMNKEIESSDEKFRMRIMVWNGIIFNSILYWNKGKVPDTVTVRPIKGLV